MSNKLTAKEKEDLKRKPRARRDEELDEDETALYNEISVRIAEGKPMPYDLDSSNKKKRSSN